MEWVAPICTLILVVVLPYIVNLLKNDYWSADIKRWFAICISVIAGVATGLLSGLPTNETLVTWVLAVIGGTQVAYSMFKAIGVTSGWLDALEGIGSNSEKQK